MESTEALIALIISIASFVFTTLYALSRFLSQRFDDKVKKVELRESYFNEIKEWSTDVIVIIQKATHLILIQPSTNNQEELFRMRQQMRTECSILIDKGRWIFPNVTEREENTFDGYGKDVLNCVVWAYKFISSIDTRDQNNNWPIRENLIETKKEFIDQIRSIINPQHRSREYRKIIGA